MSSCVMCGVVVCVSVETSGSPVVETKETGASTPGSRRSRPLDLSGKGSLSGPT